MLMSNGVNFYIILQIWMLTGDKLETATCIAKSSHLVSRTQDIHIFRPVSIVPTFLLVHQRTASNNLASLHQLLAAC